MCFKEKERKKCMSERMPTLYVHINGTDHAIHDINRIFFNR